MGNLIRRKTIVSKMGVWVEDRWSWKISWRRPLFVLEEEIQEKIMETKMLGVVKLKVSWLWFLGRSLGYPCLSYEWFSIPLMFLERWFCWMINPF